jgi:hypothetical protein
VGDSTRIGEGVRGIASGEAAVLGGAGEAKGGAAGTDGKTTAGAATGTGA